MCTLFLLFNILKNSFTIFSGGKCINIFDTTNILEKLFFSNPLSQNLFQPKGRQIYNNFNSQSACLSKFFLTPLNSFIVYPHQSFLRTSPSLKRGGKCNLSFFPHNPFTLKNYDFFIYHWLWMRKIMGNDDF